MVLVQLWTWIFFVTALCGKRPDFSPPKFCMIFDFNCEYTQKNIKFWWNSMSFVRRCAFLHLSYVFFLFSALLEFGMDHWKICNGLWRILQYKMENQASQRSILTSRKHIFFLCFVFFIFEVLHLVYFSVGLFTQCKLHAGVKSVCLCVLGAGPVSRCMQLNSIERKHVQQSARLPSGGRRFVHAPTHTSTAQLHTHRHAGTLAAHTHRL